MIKKLIWGSFLVLLLAVCGSQPAQPATSDAAIADTAVSPSPTFAATVAPTDTAVPPTAAPPTATATPQPDLALLPNEIYIYPVPNIFAGERVTFQVAADVPPDLRPEDVTVDILLDGTVIGSDVLDGRNRAGDAETIFKWVWDTTDQIGDHQVEIVLDRANQIVSNDANESNNAVAFTISVADPEQLPAVEANAVWVTAENDCCRVHVVSGTAAYRDLPDLLVAVDDAVLAAAAKLGETVDQPLDVYLIDRVLGQGGYAGSIMVVSYLDRPYAAAEFDQILTHEAIHVLDRQFAPQRIAFFAEGLAVWASGGHYKPEDVELRTAALLEIGSYVPLTQLINDFYPVQHEIGYLQAAGFVDYLIQQRGWQTFKTFYADVTASDAGDLATAVDLNLQTYYNTTLATIETDWINHLRSLRVDSNQIQDLQTTIRYYNVMRHYQTIYDPTAYFMTAWLPYPNEVRQQGNPADLTRHPQDEINIALEVMLQTANQSLRESDYNRANVMLDSIERVLQNDGAFIDPLAISYLDLVRTATKLGYEVHQAKLDANQAHLLVTTPASTTLISLTLTLRGDNWVLSN